MMSPLPGAISAKPGSATKPFFGIKPSVVSADGTPLQPNEGGFLVIDQVGGCDVLAPEHWPLVADTHGAPRRVRWHAGVAGHDAICVQGP